MTVYGHPPLICSQPISVKVVGVIALLVSCCQAQVSLEMHGETGIGISLIEFISIINFRSNCQTQNWLLVPILGLSEVNLTYLSFISLFK